MRGVSPDILQHEEEQRELQAVLASAAFARSARMEKLLSYLCTRYFSGETESIKEYDIGVDALDRRPSFDPTTDAIARVEVHRLRRKLREYYEGEGAGHALCIEIPIGSYVPTFVRLSRHTTSTELVPRPEQSLEAPAQSGATQDVASAPIVEAPARKWWARVLLYPAIALAVTAVGFVTLKANEHATRASPPPTAPLSPSLAVTAVPVSDDNVRILCGVTKPHIDNAGRRWDPDRFYTGGGVTERARVFLGRTYDFTLYSHSRSGTFSYDIPLRPGTYELHLYFAETAFGPGMPLGGGETSRLFSVGLNGRPLLTSFDILADAGGPAIADERVFKDVSPDTDGKLHLQFTGLRESAMLDAISVIPSPPHRINPVRFTVQDVSYTDSGGRSWGPDNYWLGGQKPFRVSPVRDTPDPGLYATERYGHFSYAIPVASGLYDVNIHVTETYWGSDNLGGGGVGQRVFDVFGNGLALSRHVDIVKQVGANRALVLHYAGLRPNAQGKVELSFIPIVNYATICAIEVINTGD